METVFVVSAVHRLSGRPWVAVSGRFLKGALKQGDVVVIHTSGKPEMTTEVTLIEFHPTPGTATIGIPTSAAGNILVGTRLTCT